MEKGSGRAIVDEVVGRENASVDENLRHEGQGRETVEDVTVNVNVTENERGMRANAMHQHESFGREVDGAEVRLVDYRTVTEEARRQSSVLSMMIGKLSKKGKRKDLLGRRSRIP